MHETTIVTGNLECSELLSIIYQDEYPVPGLLVLGDCLYAALSEATGDHGGTGAPHVVRGRARITARFGLSPFRQFGLVLYDVMSYRFTPEGSNAEFSGTLPNRAKTKVELWSDGSYPILRFQGREPAMAVGVNTIFSLQRQVELLTSANDSGSSREETQRKLFRQGPGKGVGCICWTRTRRAGRLRQCHVENALRPAAMSTTS